MAWVRFRKKDMPGGLWGKCKSCSEMVYTKDLLANFNVCSKCGFHMPTTVDERVRFTCDEDSFVELYTELMPVDRLEFKDKTTYQEKLEATRKKVGRNEGMTIGLGKVHGREVVLGVMNFQFLGGSMGVVVGEKVTIAVEMAMEQKLPLILICASGGARMHEGALSLMQMAKTCAALAKLAAQGGLYISILTDPTTGGVTASFATMADVILAEPNALIGFAGPRVIQNTIKQDLPAGFQRSEFLLARGQIDAIVPRPELRDRLALLIGYLQPEPKELPEALQESDAESDDMETEDEVSLEHQAADGSDEERDDSDVDEGIDADLLHGTARRRKNIDVGSNGEEVGVSEGNGQLKSIKATGGNGSERSRRGRKSDSSTNDDDADSDNVPPTIVFTPEERSQRERARGRGRPDPAADPKSPADPAPTGDSSVEKKSEKVKKKRK